MRGEHEGKSTTGSVPLDSAAPMGLDTRAAWLQDPSSVAASHLIQLRKSYFTRPSLLDSCVFLLP